ncbi:MAG TPA: hypothetical protein VMB75_08185 [Rhodocyclaceae bacterium]|nr:hypothetical protein [Rhodocyclaceae bacterium]
MKKPIVAEKPTLAADLFRAAVAFVFVVLGIAFVTVPYALSGIAG